VACIRSTARGVPPAKFTGRDKAVRYFGVLDYSWWGRRSNASHRRKTVLLTMRRFNGIASAAIASQPAIIAGSPTVTRQLHCLATRDDFANPLVSLEAEGDVGGGTGFADRQPMELNTPSVLA